MSSHFAYALFMQLLITAVSLRMGWLLCRFIDDLKDYAAVTRQTRWAAFKDIWCYTFRRWLQ